MSASVPVVSSNFKLWKSIIESNECGVCVDPTNIMEIQNAINAFLKNDELVKKCGVNGREKVEEKYNWSIEEKKLIQFYKFLLEGTE